MGKAEVQSKEGAGEAWWWSSGSSKEGEGTDWLLMSSLRRHPEALSQTPIAAKASPPPPPRHDSLRESKGGEGICCQTPAPRRGARGESGNEKQIPELRMCHDPISRVGSAGDGINHQHLTELLGRGPAGGQPWPGWLYQRHQWDLEQIDGRVHGGTRRGLPHVPLLGWWCRRNEGVDTWRKGWRRKRGDDGTEI